MAFFSTPSLSGGGGGSQYEQFVQQLVTQFPQLQQLMGRPPGPGTTLHEWGYDPTQGTGGIPMPSAGQFNQPLSFFEGAAQGQPESISGSLAGFGGQSRGSSIGQGMPSGFQPFQGPQFQQAPVFAQPGGGLAGGGGTTLAPPVSTPRPPSQSTMLTSSNVSEMPWMGGGGTMTGQGAGPSQAFGATPGFGFGMFGSQSPATGALDAQSGALARAFFGGITGMAPGPFTGQIGSQGISALSGMAGPQTVNLGMEAPGTRVSDVAPFATYAIPTADPNVFNLTFPANPVQSLGERAFALLMSQPNMDISTAKNLAQQITGYISGTSLSQPSNITSNDQLASLQEGQRFATVMDEAPYAPLDPTARVVDAMLTANARGVGIFGAAPQTQANAFDPVAAIAANMAAVGNTGQTVSQALGLGAVNPLGFGVQSLTGLQGLAASLGLNNPSAQALSDLSQVKTLHGLRAFSAMHPPDTPPARAALSTQGLPGQGTGDVAGQMGMAPADPTGGLQAMQDAINALGGQTAPGLADPNDVGLAAEAAGQADAAAAAAAAANDVGLAAEAAGMGDTGGVAGDTGGVGPDGGEW